MANKGDNIFKDTEFLGKLIVGIGEVAKITGVPARQIRYWEQKEIITSVDGIESKSRCYDYLQIKKIVLVKELLDEGYVLDAAAKKVGERMEHMKEIFQSIKDKL